MVAVIGHGQRLGETLGFVINRAYANGVDMAPVGFLLRVFQRVAVNFAGRSQQVAGVEGASNAQGIVRAQRAGFHGLDGQVGVPVG